MDYKQACKILGIEDGYDEKVVKEAYSKIIKEHHPEDDPLGYDKIHGAFSFLYREIRNNRRSRVKPLDNSISYDDSIYIKSNHSENNSVTLDKFIIDNNTVKYDETDDLNEIYSIEDFLKPTKEQVLDGYSYALSIQNEDYYDEMLNAIREMKSMFRKAGIKKLYNSKEAMKEVFCKYPKYVYHMDEFIDALILCIDSDEIDNSIHKYVAEFYDLYYGDKWVINVPGYLLPLSVVLKRRYNPKDIAISGKMLFIAFVVLVTLYFLISKLLHEFNYPFLLLNIGMIFTLLYSYYRMYQRKSLSYVETILYSVLYVFVICILYTRLPIFSELFFLLLLLILHITMCVYFIKNNLD